MLKRMWKKQAILLGGAAIGVMLALGVSLFVGRSTKHPQMLSDFEVCMRECVKTSSFATCNEQTNCGQRKPVE